MQFFLNSADVDEIRIFQEAGIIHGVTTNPSLVARSPLSVPELFKNICAIIPGPVCAQITETEPQLMLKQANKLASIGENIVIKVPMTYEGILAAAILERDGIKVNVTLCFSPVQALHAINIGASYLSVFSGRLADTNSNGDGVLNDICDLLRNYPNSKTKVIAATLNQPSHVLAAARAGAHIATAPATVYKNMIHHPMTSSGLKDFMHEWAVSKKGI